MSRKPGRPGSLRKQVEQLKRQKIAAKKVVNLGDFRDLKKESPSILVVDDDEIMRNAMKRILESEGYQVILAEDGMELSKVLETMTLDLILLDVNLPWVDGYELCRLVKGHPGLRDVPLILISARKSRADIERGFEAGCNDYIPKPFDVNQMVAIISKILTKAG